MKIEKLNENKLKITLDINDLKKRNIDIRSFVNNSPESQDLFWDVMQEAEREYGFCTEESMIYVEAHINSAGNFTLIITKSSVEPSKTPTNIKLSTGAKFKLKRKDYPDTLDDSLFEFVKFEDLRDFLKIAKLDSYFGIKLYKYENKFYLYVATCHGKDILEYSTRVLDKDYKFATIVEYGKKLYEDSSLKNLMI